MRGLPEGVAHNPPRKSTHTTHRNKDCPMAKAPDPHEITVTATKALRMERDRALAAESRARDLEQALRKTQWSARSRDGDPACPECDGWECIGSGHERDCSIGALLKAHPAPKK